MALTAVGIVTGLLSMGGSNFFENFEEFAPDVLLHWQNGWHGWDNAAAAESYTRSTFARSGVISTDVGGTADLVKQLNATSGKWEVKVWQYIPSSTTGSNTYFILMNTYADGGGKNWSTQVIFNFSNNLVYDNIGGAAGSLPLVRDQWVPILVQVDLDARTQSVYYNNALLTSMGWNRLGGVGAIAAVDLFGSAATHVYYDDFSLTQVLPTTTVKVTRWREVSSDE